MPHTKIYELLVLYMISYVIGFVLNMHLLVAKHYDEDCSPVSQNEMLRWLRFILLVVV